MKRANKFWKTPQGDEIVWQSNSIRKKMRPHVKASTSYDRHSNRIRTAEVKQNLSKKKRKIADDFRQENRNFFD